MWPLTKSHHRCESSGWRGVTVHCPIIRLSSGSGYCDLAESSRRPGQASVNIRSHSRARAFCTSESRRSDSLARDSNAARGAASPSTVLRMSGTNFVRTAHSSASSSPCWTRFGADDLRGRTKSVLSVERWKCANEDGSPAGISLANWKALSLMHHLHAKDIAWDSGR